MHGARSRSARRYAAAVNNYIAGGGSGFFVLQRNTTQVDTRVEQRDARDRLRAPVRPPAASRPEVVSDRNRRRRRHRPRAASRSRSRPTTACATASATKTAASDALVCACAERDHYDDVARTCAHHAAAAAGAGRCVLRQCRDDVRALVVRACPALAGDARLGALRLLGRRDRAAMSCRILSCLDESTGARADGRLTDGDAMRLPRLSRCSSGPACGHTIADPAAADRAGDVAYVSVTAEGDRGMRERPLPYTDEGARFTVRRRGVRPQPRPAAELQRLAWARLDRQAR
ncbi:MAG: hypothetical protein V9E96_10535 [Chitinophagaceae bacterium]